MSTRNIGFRQSTKWIFRFAILIACPIFAIAGCGSSDPHGSLSGAVTYKSNPVTAGELQIFLQNRGVGATALLDAYGKFSVAESIPVGIYQACVVPAMAPPDPTAPVKKMAPLAIPKKARDMKTSGLTVEVKRGSNSVTLELKD